MHADDAVIQVRVGPSPDAATRVRRELEPFRARLDSTTFESLRLLTTELVTNSVRHAGLAPGEQIEIKAWLGRDRVRVEVVDPGSGFEPVPDPRPDHASGWGLFLVDRIADHWGVSHPPTQTWFEIRLPGEAPVTRPAG